MSTIKCAFYKMFDDDSIPCNKPAEGMITGSDGFITLPACLECASKLIKDDSFRTWKGGIDD